MKHWSRTLAGICLSLPIAAFAADCERADIDHYLDRGFTPQQVMELCRGGARQQSPANVDQRISLRQQLTQLMDAKQIVLTQESLRFTRDLCIKYDEPNFAQQKKKACGVAFFDLPREGLKVLDQKKKLLFWGRNAVVVESPGLKRRYELGQEQLSKRNQTQLERALPQGSELLVPVREGASIAQLAEVLRSISQAKKTAP